MRVFGNLMNRIAEGAKMPEPQVGMGCTINMHSDRHAATIVKVISKTRVQVQEDKAKLVSGSRQSESQEYEYTPNPKAEVRTFSKRKNGLWIESKDGRSMGTSLTIGEREEYYDPGF